MRIKKLEVPKDRVTDSLFRHYWDNFSPDLALRINLKDSHIQQLKLLCDQMVEYEILRRIVASVGYTYEYQNRQLERPEVKMKSKCLENIVKYSKLLGIEPFKDSFTSDGKAIGGESGFGDEIF